MSCCKKKCKTECREIMVCRNGQNGLKGDKGDKGDSGTLSSAYMLVNGDTLVRLLSLQGNYIEFTGTGSLYKNVSTLPPDNNIVYTINDTGVYTINFTCIFNNIPFDSDTYLTIKILNKTENTFYVQRDITIRGPCFNYILLDKFKFLTPLSPVCVYIYNNNNYSIDCFNLSLQIIKIDDI